MLNTVKSALGYVPTLLFAVFEIKPNRTTISEELYVFAQPMSVIFYKDAHEESKAVTKAPAMKWLTEVNVVVWNINTLSSDDLIGYGRVQLQKALSQGYDDSSWAIQTGRCCGGGFDPGLWWQLLSQRRWQRAGASGVKVRVARAN
ncbi:hypothetical protein J1N35_018115 [Gossypium stocksii]|uniref:Uncharacterized protein n=1 Tax=Gossypium stocksii TaxID=47602 RepID=A0A9D3VQH8_9ROSI|nr:hypothetical protein J1N35_018115 [Gossypium stocksii]